MKHSEFSVDFHELIAVAIHDYYPITRMVECSDSLSDVTFFSRLDTNSGYRKGELADEDREKLLSRLTASTECYSYLKTDPGRFKAR